MFHAVDIVDKKEKWRFKAGAQITGSANIVKLGNDMDLVLFGSHDSNLYALNAADGEVVWK